MVCHFETILFIESGPFYHLERWTLFSFLIDDMSSTRVQADYMARYVLNALMGMTDKCSILSI